MPPDLATRADELLRSGIPNADLLAGISADSFEASGLDSDTVVLIWLAALVALDASPESYLMNLSAASQAGAAASEFTASSRLWLRSSARHASSSELQNQ
jgi:hypothetical protein